MEVRDGPEGEVFLPAIYAPAPEDAEARLGRRTGWSDDEPVRGTGLRTFLVGEDPCPLMDIGVITFEPAEIESTCP